MSLGADVQWEAGAGEGLRGGGGLEGRPPWTLLAHLAQVQTQSGGPGDSVGGWARGLLREGRGPCPEALSFFPPYCRLGRFYECSCSQMSLSLSRSPATAPQAPRPPVHTGLGRQHRATTRSCPSVNATPPGLWSGNLLVADSGAISAGPRDLASLLLACLPCLSFPIRGSSEDSC